MQDEPLTVDKLIEKLQLVRQQYGNIQVFAVPQTIEQCSEGLPAIATNIEVAPPPWDMSAGNVVTFVDWFYEKEKTYETNTGRDCAG